MESALEEQNTGTSEERKERKERKVSLQCGGTLKKLKRTDGHAVRNMLPMGERLVGLGAQPSN